MNSSVGLRSRLKCRCCVSGFPAAAAADRGQDVVRTSGGGAWHQTSNRSGGAGLWSEGSNLYRYVKLYFTLRRKRIITKMRLQLLFTLNPMSLDELILPHRAVTAPVTSWLWWLGLILLNSDQENQIKSPFRSTGFCLEACRVFEETPSSAVSPSANTLF